MSNPLTFLLPLPYHRVRRTLVVQTGDGAQIGEVVRRVRETFPGATVEVLLREADAARRAEIAADEVRIARYEERLTLVRSLRRQRFDVIAYQLGDGTARGELARLPFLLRCRSIIGFNPRLDYFPLNLFRIADVAHHFGLAGTPGAGSSVARTLVRLAAEVVLRPLVTLYLLASVARIRLAAAVRPRAAADRS
jgi:hypothetical protein